MPRIELSGCAIIDDEKLLLLYKRKHGHYEFPGGKVNEGESLEAAAIRECREELGCDVELVRYLGFKEFHIDGRDFRSHKYLGRIKSGQSPIVAEPDVFRDLLWLPMREYTKQVVAPNVKDFCDDFIQGKLKLE